MLAIRSKSGRTIDNRLMSSLQPGTVKQTYGKMAEIAYADGGFNWAYCDKMKVNDKPEEEKKDEPVLANTSGGSGGKKACAFRPEKKKHVVCQTMSAGKCIAGARSCKPPTKCVYRPEEGKYVKCTTFSNGKCRSGTRACKPPGKCVFSAKKNKYVYCNTFTKGKCISGTRACKPS